MADPISEGEFDRVADDTLRALDRALNELEADFEADLESGILTLEFADGVKFVVNSHRAARQIWMAAAANAWHFDVESKSGVWTATKTHEELWTCIKRQVERKLGRSIDLEPS